MTLLLPWRPASWLLIAALMVLPDAAVAGGTPPLDPPPAWFSPSVIRYVGGPNGMGAEFDQPLFIGAIDGSNLTRIADPGVVEAWWAGDGRVLMQVQNDDGDTTGLTVRDADGTIRVLAPRMETVVLDADGETAYGFVDPRKRGAVLRRIPLDGSAPSNTRIQAHQAYDIVVSPDERSLAVGTAGDPSVKTKVSFDGRAQRSIGPVTPLGFDARSRLIRAGLRIQAQDPVSGRTRTLLRGSPLRYGYTTPDGRYLVLAWGGDRQFVILDLLDGDRRDLRLPGPGDWELIRPGIDRYVVLRHTTSGQVDGVAIHDLYEGWTGFLPWQGSDAQ
jgi:dipeptidyl aminopeptidase/acylaminoacyl peptidase